MQTSLFNLLCELFKVKNVEIALFCGTPSVHQKITMQITDGLNIVGYCKISEKKEVKALFKHEEDIFKTLHGNGFTNTPQCLYNARLKDETYIFAQTTTKTKNSKILHQLSAMHWDFLSQLHQKTKTSLPFEKSDFYEALNLLKQNLSYLSVADAKSVSAAIAMVEKHYEGKEIMFSFYHADFTPWNMFVEKGELFVFDWEYAKRTFPPFLDAFHFLTQVCIFEQHKDAEGIMANYRANRHIFAEYFDNPDFSYQCYLLGIISFYFDRDKDDFNKSNIQIWAALLRLLQEHA
ncbi:MAG: Phosphotransferase enzyme family protein [Bacteroidetes bacterium ADurb.Bin234]|nr:MAG: Phosphotransferase enzyme family protein [Bacteroidetes bacterium ADurb.Bin234]